VPESAGDSVRKRTGLSLRGGMPDVHPSIVVEERDRVTRSATKVDKPKLFGKAAWTGCAAPKGLRVVVKKTTRASRAGELGCSKRTTNRSVGRRELRTGSVKKEVTFRNGGQPGDSRRRPDEVSAARRSASANGG
jgi:hypothetical protein